MSPNFFWGPPGLRKWHFLKKPDLFDLAETSPWLRDDHWAWGHVSHPWANLPTNGIAGASCVLALFPSILLTPDIQKYFVYTQLSLKSKVCPVVNNAIQFKQQKLQHTGCQTLSFNNSCSLLQWRFIVNSSTMTQFVPIGLGLTLLTNRITCLSWEKILTL